MDVFVRSSYNSSLIPLASKKDTQYKRDICHSLGISGIKPIHLQSIIGPDEFKSIIKEKSPNTSFYTTGRRAKGKEDTPNTGKLENVKMKLFGANIHVHTTNSDGALTTQEVLDQAASYADQYSKENEGKPFLIGITDHNTIEGCKEAVKIIAQNPAKYKNLRVVLGCEISTKEDNINDYSLKKPMNYHVLALCLNPFDNKTNSFLQDLQVTSNSPMNIRKISIDEAFNGIKHQEQCFFSLAHPAYPNVRESLHQNEDPYEAIKKKMARFAEVVGNKGLYFEAYYGGYTGNIALDEKMHNIIDRTCDELGYYKAGGLDTHCESIFFGDLKERRKKNN